MLKNLYSYLFIDDLIGPSTDSVAYTGELLKRKLRRDLAYLTLFSYFLLVFNPVMPIIADKMAHTFWEEYHLITVHGVYGNAHVNTELDKTAKQADKEKSPKTSNAGSESFSHLITNISYNFSSDRYIIRSYPSYKFFMPVSHPDPDYQPPKA